MRFVQEELATFHSVLREDNCTLELLSTYFSFEGFDLSEEAKAQCQDHLDAIDFYLTLNQGGRAKLLAGAPLDDWIDALSTTNVSTIYYYLQKNPLLFHCLHDTKVPQKAKGRYRIVSKCVSVLNIPVRQLMCFVCCFSSKNLRHSNHPHPSQFDQSEAPSLQTHVHCQ